MICARKVNRGDPVMSPCPDCGHLLALHIGEDQCPVCLLINHPVLKADAVMTALRESLLVVREGETLIVRVPPYLTPAQVGNYQEQITHMAAELPCKVMILTGDEFAVATATGEILVRGGDEKQASDGVQ